MWCIKLWSVWTRLQCIFFVALGANSPKISKTSTTLKYLGDIHSIPIYLKNKKLDKRVYNILQAKIDSTILELYWKLTLVHETALLVNKYSSLASSCSFCCDSLILCSLSHFDWILSMGMGFLLSVKPHLMLPGKRIRILTLVYWS